MCGPFGSGDTVLTQRSTARLYGVNPAGLPSLKTGQGLRVLEEPRGNPTGM